MQEALDAFQEKHRQTRKYVLGESLRVLVFLVAFLGVVQLFFPFRRRGDQTITAGVYRSGELIAYTDVEIQGEIEQHFLPAEKSYWGRFAIGCVEWTCREGAEVRIGLNNGKGVDSYLWNGTLAGNLRDLDAVFSPNMKEFAMALQSPYHHISGEPDVEEWCILATSPEMYEAYCTQMAYPPPTLTSPALERLPEFPSAWKQW